MPNFTPEDLLEYHYGELEPENAVLLEEALAGDWTLREKLAVIREAANRLDKSMYAPREAVINRLMDYAAEKVNAAAVNS